MKILYLNLSFNIFSGSLYATNMKTHPKTIPDFNQFNFSMIKVFNILIVKCFDLDQIFNFLLTINVSKLMQ